MGGSVGLGEGFGLTSPGLGFSTETDGLASWAGAPGPIRKRRAPNAMNLRNGMTRNGENEKTSVYLAEPTCNASHGPGESGLKTKIPWSPDCYFYNGFSP